MDDLNEDHGVKIQFPDSAPKLAPNSVPNSAQPEAVEAPNGAEFVPTPMRQGFDYGFPEQEMF